MKAKMAEKFPLDRRKKPQTSSPEELTELHRSNTARLWETRSEEERQAIGTKISRANAGKRNRLGHRNSDEHRHKISEAQKGRPLAQDHVEALRRAAKTRKNKVWTDEERAAHAEKIRASWERRRAVNTA